MSLSDVYQDAWIDKYSLPTGWIVNNEPTKEIELGAVGRIDNGIFQRDSTLWLKSISGPEPNNNVRPQVDNAWNFQSNQNIKVNVVLGAQTAEAIKWLADASAGIEASFGKEAGVAIYGTTMWWDGYKDLDVVRLSIVDAAKSGKLQKGQAVVVERQISGKGVMLTAEGTDGAIKAKAKASVAPAHVTVATLSGNLEVVSTSGQSGVKSFGDDAIISMRILLLGKHGWFWWRRWYVAGATALGPDAEEEMSLNRTEGDQDNQYFAFGLRRFDRIALGRSHKATHT